MTIKPILAIAIFSALAVSISAQSSFQSQLASFSAPAVSDESIRARRVEEKAAEAKAVVVVNVASVERIAFDLVNAKRSELGLGPLAWNDGLLKAARDHSQSMAEFKYFSHRGHDGKMVSDRADKAGVGKWRSIGENIAFNRGYSDPISKAVQLWLDSPSHRQNMLDSTWKESAIGVAVAPDGSYYFTQVFLKK
jgi:uncharacterized protein YkwD